MPIVCSQRAKVNPSENVLKITVVPLSVEDSAFRNMLEQFNVTILSDIKVIKYEKIRNVTTQRMTGILNGNRYFSY